MGWPTSPNATGAPGRFGSFTPELGYILPPGSWGLQAPLGLARDLGTRSHRRLTPILPLTITP
jgi:hypothetical protein